MNGNLNRQEFARRQAEMTSRWFASVKRNSADLETYLSGRKAAYNERWKEALRFMQPGARVLDIGGGHLYPELLDLLRGRQIDYWYLDVDDRAVEKSRWLAADHGFRHEQFSQGFNDELRYPDQAFDAVFSSHCIEHSFDLLKTLSEIRRVLRPGGVLAMAVPLGWELNPEHPYFFEPQDWLALVEDAGFDIRLSQLGQEYPETGHDLFIAARKTEAIEARRIAPALYAKEGLTFIAPTNEAISYSGSHEIKPDAVICRDEWAIRITIPVGSHRVLPIFARHPWSGVVRLSCEGIEAYRDLYSSHSYFQPVEISPAAAILDVVPIDRNPLARGREAVLAGVLIG